VVKKILKRLIILALHKTGGKGKKRGEEKGKVIIEAMKKDHARFLLTALLDSVDRSAWSWRIS
jgi:hypothetical protein